jgi:hypothetical protein
MAEATERRERAHGAGIPTLQRDVAASAAQHVLNAPCSPPAAPPSAARGAHAAHTTSYRDVAAVAARFSRSDAAAAAPANPPTRKPTRRRPMSSQAFLANNSRRVAQIPAKKLCSFVVNICSQPKGRLKAKLAEQEIIPRKGAVLNVDFVGAHHSEFVVRKNRVESIKSNLLRAGFKIKAVSSTGGKSSQFYTKFAKGSPQERELLAAEQEHANAERMLQQEIARGGPLVDWGRASVDATSARVEELKALLKASEEGRKRTDGYTAVQVPRRRSRRYVKVSMTVAAASADPPSPRPEPRQEGSATPESLSPTSTQPSLGANVTHLGAT